MTGRKEIHFQNHQYKVFNESNLVSNRTATTHSQHRNQGGPRREHVTNVAHIPYPQEKDVASLRSLMSSMGCVKRAKRPQSVFEKVVKRFDAVQFHLKELAKQRDRLLMALQSDPCAVVCTRMETTDEIPPNCCRHATGVEGQQQQQEDLKQVIYKGTDAIQSATMETNLVSDS